MPRYNKAIDRICYNGLDGFLFVSEKNSMTGTVAYLVLAHEANEQLFRLTNALLADKRSRVYLHLDAKLLDVGWVEVFGDPRLIVLSGRLGVNWGGYSVVKATLLLLRRALADVSNEQFALLSGSCFPLMPTDQINDRVLGLSTPLISLWGKIDPALNRGEGLGRYVVTKFHPHDRDILTPKTSRVHERAWNLYKWLNARLPYERKVDIVDMWKGSQFFIVNHEYAKVCANPPAALVKALRYALAPDEIMFTTLIVRYGKTKNKTFATVSSEEAQQGSHFIIKRVPPKRTLHERMFHKIDLRQLALSDADKAVASGALFARKCSADVSESIAAWWTSEHPVEVKRIKVSAAEGSNDLELTVSYTAFS